MKSVFGDGEVVGDIGDCGWNREGEEKRRDRVVSVRRHGNSRCTRGCGGIAVRFAWRRQEGMMFGQGSLGAVNGDWAGGGLLKFLAWELTTLFPKAPQPQASIKLEPPK